MKTAERFLPNLHWQMSNCTFSNSTLLDVVHLLGAVLSMLSLIMCIVAIAILVHYKLYRLFNYRLILYLIVSFLIKSTSNSLELPFFWNQPYLMKHQYTYNLCQAVGFIGMYSFWSMQLCIAFMTAEIFSMIIFSADLRKVELPLTLACFSLPIPIAIVAIVQQTTFGLGKYFWCVGIVNNHGTTFWTDFYKFVLPTMIIMGICTISIATAMFWLACRAFQWIFISNNDDDRYLLHSQARKYKKALKETLPFSIYPIVLQLVLFLFYLQLMQCKKGVLYVHTFIVGSIGSIASTIFFVHMKALGRHRRNIFRNRSPTLVPSERVEPINEGQTFTAIGSVTGTHITDFDPLTESNVEPYM